MAISVFHEGSDGLKLEYVEVGTDSRIVHCPIGVKLDNGEFYLFHQMFLKINQFLPVLKINKYNFHVKIGMRLFW